MLRIRFPDGQCIQYNDATHHRTSANGDVEILRTAGDKDYWVAMIPKGTPCVIEHVQPCAVTNPIAREMTPESALALVRKHLRSIDGYRIRDLKNELRDFNARSRAWRT